jgi:uncharacterized protein YjbI with pentapeptide repeats
MPEEAPMLKAVKGQAREHLVSVLLLTSFCQLALADETACRAVSLPTWSLKEQWIWNRVCSGQTADLAEWAAMQHSQSLDAHAVDGAFLETILLQHPFRSVIPREGIRFLHAYFTKTLDLDSAQIDASLWLDRSLFKEGLSLRELSTTKALTLEGSTVHGAVDLTNAHLGRLSLSGGSFSTVVLAGAIVDGDVTIGTRPDDQSTTRLSGGLDMTSIRIGRILSLARASLQKVSLQGSHIPDQLNAEQARVHGDLLMSSAQIGQYFWMRDGSFKDVILIGASIAGDLIASNSKVTGSLALSDIHVGGNLQLDDISATRVSLSDAELGGDLMLNGATLDSLKLDDIKLRGDLSGDAKTHCALIDASEAQIGGDIALHGITVETIRFSNAIVEGSLSLDDARIIKLLDAEGVQVKGSLYFRRGENAPGSQTGSPPTPALLAYSKVDGIVDISGTVFDAVDLTGAKIGQMLRLGMGEGTTNTWRPPSFMSLRDVSVPSFFDGCDKEALECLRSWSAELDLQGFTYSYSGAHRGAAAGAVDMSARPAEWWIAILKRQAFSPQPYQQAAAHLRSLGRSDAGDEVQYAGKWAELTESFSAARSALVKNRVGGAFGYFTHGLSLLLLWSAVGFGIGYHTLSHTVFWVVLWVAVGVFVMHVFEPRHSELPPLPIAFSFDMLLPVARLNEEHYRIVLTPGVRRYFYAHKLAGYVLAFFLVVGLGFAAK